MVEFDAAAQPKIDTHPPISRQPTVGTWANIQIAFFLGVRSMAAGEEKEKEDVVSVGFTLWQSNAVPSRRGSSAGMTMVVYDVNATVQCGS